jgi:ubiquinone/menaquinone biosynthesis C-methylase UbiE
MPKNPKTTSSLWGIPALLSDAGAFAARVVERARRVPSVEAATAAYYDDASLHRRYDHPVPTAYAGPKVAWAFDALGRIGVDVQRATILDVGGGNGFFSRFLAAGCGEAHVLDVSAQQLALNPLPASHKHVGSAYDLPFEDQSFDVAFSSNLLHHLDRPEEAVKEMARVARRAVFVIEPSAHNWPLWIGAQCIRHERGATRFTKVHVEALLRAGGLEIERHTFAGGMVLPNRTPTAALPFAFASSTRRALCMSQMFLCTKRDPHHADRL